MEIKAHQVSCYQDNNDTKNSMIGLSEIEIKSLFFLIVRYFFVCVFYLLFFVVEKAMSKSLIDSLIYIDDYIDSKQQIYLLTPST